MKKTALSKKAISIMLAVLMAVTGIVPAFEALGADGVEGYYEIELFYKDTNTIVPSTMLNDQNEEVNYIEYMVEGDELALTYKLIDTEMPNNGYVKWYSETPTLVDVTQEGVVKAFDSSKGAVIHSWIDNEVKTIPLVGGAIAKVIEKALFNDYVNVDTMDTDAIIAIVEAAFGSDSLLDQWIESYKGELIDSLRYYLDNINSNIHVQLFDYDGTLLDDDYVQICVTRNNEWYANFLPNGTHITNKSQINTTVAVGSSVQLYAVTTPTRLQYGCVYSVKSSSIFEQGKVVATVDDSGLVKFKNKGTVTIMVSPDTEQVIENILKLVNYFYEINTELIDSKQLADILIKYIGLDINRNVLAGILDTIFIVVDIAGDTADPVKLSATAVKIIANLVLQFAYNDTITFNVVDSQPLTDFSIKGASSVREGSQIQLQITDIVPEVGNTNDITWRSSDPTIASVDPITGIITGRDAGGSLGAMSSQQCTIFAKSAANNIEKPYQITVTGRTGRYISDIEILGEPYLEMGMETDYSFEIYPKRVAEGDNLYFKWGIQTGVDEESGDPVYSWASDTEEKTVTDGRGSINEFGHYRVLSGGVTTIALEGKTGYYLSNGTFFEISKYIKTFEVTNGIPVESIDISVSDNTGSGSIKNSNTITINGERHTFVSVNASVAYYEVGAVISSNVFPANASNKNLTWHVDNNDFNVSVSDDTHTISVKRKAGKESADTFNIYAVSADGLVKSNVITVCVAKNTAESNVIDQSEITVIKGRTADTTHTIRFSGNSDGTYSACYKCNWFSSDESIFTVATKNNDNRDARITAQDVGTATLTCVSTDGGIASTCTVIVLPDKDYLRSIVNLCDKTVIRRTAENAKLYKEYMNKLDLAYTVLYHKDMASQVVCDTTADELLYAFYKLGGFIGLNSVKIVDKGGKALEDKYVTVNVGLTSNYTNYSYDFDAAINPKSAMYSHVTWTSSNSSVKVDSNGVCKPSKNDPACAIITCTVTDYMGGSVSDSVCIAFSRHSATGVSLNTDNIEAGLIGQTQTLTANVSSSDIAGASNKNVIWTSSDPSIASVDSNGVVTFNKGGYCVITATTIDGGYTASCTVTVVTNYTNLELLIQQYTDLSLNSANYYPDSWEVFTNAMNKAKNMVNVRRSSQDEVDAMYNELLGAYESLQKYNYIQKIELYLDGEQTQEFYQYDLSLLSEGISYTNAVLDLNIRLYPNNGSYETVLWESSTPDISVTTDGKCSPTANKSCYGSITCTVTDHYGNSFTDSVWVSFSYFPVTGLDISESAISGSIGETHQLTVTVLPTGDRLLHIGSASIKDFYWESDDENIAIVDETGLVTFTGTGSTIVRAVSYDGGIFAECRVSGDGDRSKLQKALDDYANVDYTNYEYNYGIAFMQAYSEAQRAITDSSYTQDRLDLAADNLINAYNTMLLHPAVKIQGININYTTTKNPTFGGKKQVLSGTVSNSDCLSINLSKDHADYNYNNWVTLTAAPSPSNAAYKSVKWAELGSSKAKVSIDGATVEITPKDRSDGAWAVLTITFTDDYGKSVVRAVTVTLSDKVCTGIDITDSDKSVYATAPATKINYTLSGSPEFNAVGWSSSDESVVTVDAQGYFTPVDKGTATITAKTVDGGFTDSIRITVSTDFSELANKYNSYYETVQSVTNEYTYTRESLDALIGVLGEALVMINDNRATQAEVNEMVARLDEAYNLLVVYVAVNSISISAKEDENITFPNDGYIRYSATSINNKQIKLKPVFNDPDARYVSLYWSSSNPDITVDDEGILTNTLVEGGVTKITASCTNVFGITCTNTAYVTFARYGVKAISFKDEMVHGAPSKTVTLTPTFTGTGAVSSVVSVKDCIYTSSDPSIATVNNKGEVTFQSQGTAVITATALDGGYTATINAFTTWDTNALEQALEEAQLINYKDYAYSYGMEFQSAYENAQTVFKNIYASQEEINVACSALTEAMSNLEGNEFIVPQISLVQNGNEIANNHAVQVNGSYQAVVSVALNEGAMYKSLEITTENESNVTAVLSGNDINITKTPDTDGSLTINIRCVDDYDREYTASYTISVINQVTPAQDFVLMANGEQIDSMLSVSAGGSYAYFKGLEIDVVTDPVDANAYTIEWTSTNNNYITMEGNKIVLTALAKTGIVASRQSKITCKLTNNDGTVIEKTFTFVITRA